MRISETMSAGIKFIVFAAVTLLSMGLLITTIGNYDFKETQGYKAVFSDAVNLNGGDEVRIAGVRVGSIGKVEILEQDKALVSFTVDKTVPVTDSTLAVIRYRNLIGQRYLALIDGPGVGDTIEPGSTIPLERTRPALDLNDLFNGFRPLLTGLSPADVNKLSYELIQVLQGEGQTVNALFRDVSSLTNTLADRDQLIGDVIENLDAVLGPLNDRNRQLSELILNAQQLVSNLAGDRNAIGDSLTGIDQVAEETAAFLERARPSLKADINHLATLATKLDRPKQRKELQHFIDYQPFKLRVASAISGYGAFQLFFICSTNFILPNGTVTEPVFNDVKRCTNP